MTSEELLRLIDRAADEGWKELDLSGMGLSELPKEIGQLTQLESLVLGKWHEREAICVGNQFTEFPDAVLQLTNLKHLDISGNQVSVIPNEIKQLSNLVTFYVRHNRINAIPDSIGQLVHLYELDLYHNQVTVIPDEIASLSSLNKLRLSGNQISIIPESIGQLSHLSGLYVAGNQIRVIPETIAQLANLSELYLANNEINAIPEEIAKLANLTKLYLWENQISVIPEAIGQISKLTSLHLADNQISVIPEAIGQLANLAQLYLQTNQISVIPETIAQLTNLTGLYLGGNQISVIPKAIAQLANLTHLYLRRNQISVIPKNITQLPNLKELDLRYNPLPIPPALLGGVERDDVGDRKAILDFYFQTRNPNDTEELNEAKLIIVGEGGAGKTTLANKLLKPDYPLPSPDQDTHTEGIDITPWEFDRPTEKPFRVHLWDFAGQEIKHATHQFFLTDRSLYLLVVDERRQNANLPYWLEIIQLLSNNSPVLLVQNERQNCTCPVNFSQLRGQFDNLETAHPINLADNRGLAQLKQAIQNRVTALSHVSIPIPKRWVAVRHILENSAKSTPHIPFHEFQRICTDQGFVPTDKRAVLELSAYLHALGIILHFQKDSTLKHLVILRPNWATNAVYKVTENATICANGGHFTQQNLSEIWQNEYSDLHDELITLMKNFKLCYELPTQPGQYITPQLLPLETPSYDWNPADNLILRYEYDFLPKGILTRLIVEMHDRIHTCDNIQIVWRDGAILTNGHAQAEVIETYHKKEIAIRIWGNQKRSLLEAIRRELWKIHSSYNSPTDPPDQHRLKYKELIPCNCPKCKGTQNPHLYELRVLQQFLSDRQYEIQCQKSYKMINVRGLVDDFPDYSREWEQEYDDFPKKAYEDMTEIVKLAVSQPITVQQTTIQENQPMSTTINQHHSGSGDNVAGNKIINNNANRVELIQLIATMRQTAAQFPAEVQESVILDIEDVEAELEKPEGDRDFPRLKKRLLALATAGSLVAAPIAGMTDFANNAIDLGSKLGIELPLGSAP
jgi:internalin A